MAEYVVDQYNFRSKKAAENYLSIRLNSHEEGDLVTDPELAGFLTALVRRHPNPAEKIGNGISHWVVMRNNDLSDFQSSHLGFRIVQVDSPIPVPFAYSKILYPRAAQANFAAALTLEAQEVTRRIRREAFDRGPAICAETGEPIFDIHDAQAVHSTPGRGRLHQMFLESEGLSVDQAKIHKPDGKSEYRLVDRTLAKRWVEFQEAHIDGMTIVKVHRSRSNRESEGTQETEQDRK